MKRFAILFAALALTAALPARADPRGAEVEAAMREYLRLWNAHDAAAITDHIYRLDGSNPMGKPGALQAEFDRLKVDGYDHSDIASVKGCLISKDVGVVELRFSRVRADGSALPPKDRASLYLWRRFPDGWRVVQFFGMGPGASFTCVSAAAP